MLDKMRQDLANESSHDIGTQLSFNECYLVSATGGPADLEQGTATSFSATAKSPTSKKTTELEALPTDHDDTASELDPDGDDYLLRHIDPAGEKKVDQNGQLLGDRKYGMRTIRLPNRGDKLFVFAEDCADLFGYRDSRALFDRNHTLKRISLSQLEEWKLVEREILRLSDVNPSTAIVTARSVFRRFGSQVIVNCYRVRDDYWEARACDQGFADEDVAVTK